MRAVRAQGIGGAATAWQSMGCAGIVALTLPGDPFQAIHPPPAHPSPPPRGPCPRPPPPVHPPPAPRARQPERGVGPRSSLAKAPHPALFAVKEGVQGSLR